MSALRTRLPRAGGRRSPPRRLWYVPAALVRAPRPTRTFPPRSPIALASLSALPSPSSHALPPHPLTLSHRALATHQVMTTLACVGLARWSFVASSPSLPAVGGINLRCPRGMLEPTSRGPNPDKFPGTLTAGLSHYADHVYIICTDQCDMTVPEEFGPNVMMLNGYELDKCNGIDLPEYNHWIKASQSHQHAITHAKKVGAKIAMVIEQDAAADPDLEWSMGNWAELNAALDGAASGWNMVRLGYRPMQLELGPDAETCPQEACRCQQVGEMLCWLPYAGCDLRASDMYMIHERAFDRYTGALTGGNIVDNGVLQGIDKQLVVTPQVSYQTQASSDYSSLEHQKDVSTLFLERCHLGVTRTQARLAAEAEAGARDAATLGIGAAGNRGSDAVAPRAIDLGALGTVEVGEAAGGLFEALERRRSNAATAVEALGGSDALRRAQRRLGND